MIRYVLPMFLVLTACAGLDPDEVTQATQCMGDNCPPYEPPPSWTCPATTPITVGRNAWAKVDGLDDNDQPHTFSSASLGYACSGRPGKENVAVPQDFPISSTKRVPVCAGCSQGYPWHQFIVNGSYLGLSQQASQGCGYACTGGTTCTSDQRVDGQYECHRNGSTCRTW